LERINNRIDNSFGFEKHYIRGKAKMQTRVGLALAVMMAMALGHVRARSYPANAFSGASDSQRCLTIYSKLSKF
jgi:hypothetical protein